MATQKQMLEDIWEILTGNSDPERGIVTRMILVEKSIKSMEGKISDYFKPRDDNDGNMIERRRIGKGPKQPMTVWKRIFIGVAIPVILAIIFFLWNASQEKLMHDFEQKIIDKYELKQNP